MKRLLVALAFAAAAGGGLVAQEIHSANLLTTEKWLDWERVSDAQISPDGSRIVYTRQSVNKLEDKWESALWMVNADGTRAAAEFTVTGSYLADDAGLPPAHGQKYELPCGAFFEIRDNKVARVSNFYNLQDWLKQVK